MSLTFGQLKWAFLVLTVLVMICEAFFMLYLRTQPPLVTYGEKAGNETYLYLAQEKNQDETYSSTNIYLQNVTIRDGADSIKKKFKTLDTRKVTRDIKLRQNGNHLKKQLRGHFDGATDLRIVFLHIRKTGGSTMWALLRKLLPSKFKDPCLCSIKSPPMYSSRCQTEAAQEASLQYDMTNSSAIHPLGSKLSSKPYHWSIFLNDTDIEISESSMIQALIDAGYHQNWILDLTPHHKRIMKENMLATSQVGV